MRRLSKFPSISSQQKAPSSEGAFLIGCWPWSSLKPFTRCQITVWPDRCAASRLTGHRHQHHLQYIISHCNIVAVAKSRRQPIPGGHV